jgi:hypothetical protein
MISGETGTVVIGFAGNLGGSAFSIEAILTLSTIVIG